uniref:Uncharacterized protein n=1 Tax=viral metagenome TaxID=1070528 RepID=A0A6C0AY01_9ZZZZ
MYETENQNINQRELLNSQPRDNSCRCECYQFIKDLANLLIPITIFASILSIAVIFIINQLYLYK